MNLEEEISKGNKYKEYREVFDEIMDAMKESINTQMDKVPMVNTEMHTRLILTRQLLNSIDKHVQQVILTGKMAEKQLSDEIRQEEQRKWWQMRA